ncbi:MAG: hypothetical protein COW01_04630 [Bdellovibrionales bacterium CG12_big_fil_rev_8_21_14_0_65_38_15]|nr:MAG: hypothetical protein COW79_11950 [Bdellovibrionales bacterium CG22_combo_CG10-13_8_21_14_all_38_13]PIQ56343.1 MAG: hypothetical protein COW01_04630 [Bdellovibrionales bacterium CG12_big_fil_rev_8_21_14_0_65_38_15]PIR29374.1 MAG: hypothetical protein COV38_11565 [Bdellovibrionales bacterium CG11_big_fil_rev_8_21_14_0_20_38_13]
MEKDLSSTPVTFKRNDYACEVSRLPTAVTSLKGESIEDIAFGLGIAHARDRTIQMELARLAGQGRLSEKLKSDQETESIDIFMREVGISYEAKKEVSQINNSVLTYLEAYSAGVNYVWENEKLPWEFKLTRHKPEPWKPEHTILTVKLMSYIGLAQTQEDIERLIIQAVIDGSDVNKLKSLFYPFLDELNVSRIEKIKSIKFLRQKLPIEVKTLSYLPKLLASNNWVIAPAKAKKRQPIMCSDPHLEVNRLPGVWHEVCSSMKDNEQVGITMPGVPGILMGRNRDITFSFTYGFMDMIDFFIEEIRDGKSISEDGPRELNKRIETIKRKGKTPLQYPIFETQSGILELPLISKIEDGLYLSRAWTNHRGGMGDTIEALMAVQTAKDVDEFTTNISNVAISANWLVADKLGQIAYQQSGRAPKRKGHGLVPLEAWVKENLWNGKVPSNELEHIKNPSEGYLSTANNDIRNTKCKSQLINLPMGTYRNDRIKDVLSGLSEIDTESMKTLQNDLYSLQAEQFLEVIEGEFPETPLGQTLKSWDCHYNVESIEATLFESFYKNLIIETFGDNFFGENSIRFLLSETSTITDYYHLFDRILLTQDSDTLELWFGGAQKRKELFQKCLSITLSKSNSYQLLPWGQVNTVTMKNLFFQGKLPAILGFDHGPIGLPGGRATIVQGAVYKAHGRESSFAPSWRMIADLSENNIHTILAGGISDRRFSADYKLEIFDWLSGRYKILPLSKK